MVMIIRKLCGVSPGGALIVCWFLSTLVRSLYAPLERPPTSRRSGIPIGASGNVGARTIIIVCLILLGNFLTGYAQPAAIDTAYRTEIVRDQAQSVYAIGWEDKKTPPQISSDAVRKKTRLNISTGAEVLTYKEHEPDTFTESKAVVVNPIIHLDWILQHGFLEAGLKGTLPVAPTEDIEEWDSYGIRPFQTNVFKCEWQRIDAYLGYFMAPGENRFSGTIYLGLRSSLQKQTRDDFIQQGVRLAGKSVEEVESLGVLIGLRGRDLALKKTPSPWTWNYSLEFIAPLSVKTTNSLYPDLKFKDKHGFSYELSWGVEYKLGSSWSCEGTLYGGRVHWKGSKWETTPYGQLQWPENDTDYLGVKLGLALRF